ncbi:MAG: hypothetical protein U5L98_00255 [Halomonas sp.]|uniref:hypothetical protein n=1 Tax=Halomonas sp. TaxID=1486246 RepID=UPI002ACE9DCC|nr:hypothetical protein [Halomonas sp.]MDZ7851105.1 hypothetical protein [Halomonas sp.]
MKAIALMVAMLVKEPRMLALIVLVTLAYGGLYLWLNGDISGGGTGGLQAAFPAWERAFEARGPFQFEPVGLVQVGTLVWTFSPLNTLLGMTMGGLLGLAVAAGLKVWKVPRQCGLGASGAGTLAGIPALLAGGACCAPLVLIWLGLPIAGTVASISPLLVPLALVILLVVLWRLAKSLTSSTS